MADGLPTAEDIKKLLEQFQGRLDSLELPDKKVKEFRTQIEGLLHVLETKGDSAVSSVNDALASMVKTVEETGNAGEKFSRSLNRLLKSITGVEDASHTLIGSFAALAKEEGGLVGIQKKLAKSFEKTFSTFNVGVSIARKVTESTITLAKEIDSQTAAFNRSIGAGGKYNKELQGLEYANRSLGIRIGDVANSYSSLIGTFSEFTLMSQSQREAIAQATAQFDKFGIASASTAQVLETGTKVLGLSAEQALNMEKQVIATANAMGQDLGQAVADLASALPKLAAFGDRTTEVFENLQIQSKNTGLAIDELIGISEQFMTFNDAARAAGNLNAVLGTQMFDTMQMLRAQMKGPDAFAKLMSEQLQAAVGDFDTLDVFQQGAIANAAGLSVAQVRAMVEGQEAANKATDAMKRHNLTQEEMNELMAAGRGFAEELKILFSGFAIAVQPALTYMVGAMRGFNTLMQGTPNLLRPIAAFFSVILVAGIAKAIVKIGAQTIAIATQIPVVNSLAAAWRRVSDARGTGGIGPMHGPDPAPTRGSSPGFLGRNMLGATRGARALSGLKLGGGFAALGTLAEIGAGGDKSEAIGSGIGSAGGAALGAALGGPLGMMAGGWLGGKAGRAIGGMFASGTDTYPGGPLLNVAGESGPELIIPPPQSAIINNKNTERLRQPSMSKQGSKEVVSAINSLNKKMDQVIGAIRASGGAVIELDKREIGRTINEHFGAPGSKPLRNVSGR